VNLLHKLNLGRTARVIGTIITEDYLRQWEDHPAALPCDFVELRVDGFSEFEGWLDIGRQIEALGHPVIATIRSSAEGGKWSGAEDRRERLLKQALKELSGIDVELNSEIARPLAASAAAAGKLCVLSHHDFQKTPPLEELLAMVRRMHESGSIAKIAATANSSGDVDTLRALLRRDWNAPICVIGMGARGRETRLDFPREGSCLAYGYLDTPGAPGQYSARELREILGKK
jgi:3-dehydroquinate dehydratase-1